jgi:hypothetical protein
VVFEFFEEHPEVGLVYIVVVVVTAIAEHVV